MERNKPFKIPLFKNERQYQFLLLFASALMAYYRHWWLALAVFAALSLITANSLVSRTRSAKLMRDYFEALTTNLDIAAKDAVLNFPFPMAIVDSFGAITWYNDSLGEALAGWELFRLDIKKLIPGMDIAKIIAEGGAPVFSFEIEEKSFEVRAHATRHKPEDALVILYFVEHSERDRLRKICSEQKVALGLVSLDNYEELMQNTQEADKPRLIVAIDKTLSDWAAGSGGVIKKLERDRYCFLCTEGAFEQISEEKFEVLDLVREISHGNKIPPTLSIGMGHEGESVAQCDEFARAALDMALGRGGDQVVVKGQGAFKYFGGNTKEVEKRTRVKARVVAYALRELISQSVRVLIMGHQMADGDSFGAAIGLYAEAKRRCKNTHIVLGAHDETVTALLKRFSGVEKYEGAFITKQQAKDLITLHTLLIVVDTHKSGFVEAPELLGMTGQIVVIDHHRRSQDFIENAVLVYHEPFASSSSEMVTEVLQYMDEHTALTSLEAEALYAGIMLDTKSFSVKTGVRTFEAAAYLRRLGVDTVSVKRLFQSELDDFMRRAEIVRGVEIHRDKIAISATEESLAQSLAAQAADELLGITGITSSFVICKNNNKVHISGRSLGDINVQVILEKLGGGGHLSVAGAQIEGVSAAEAKVALKAAINEYYREQ